MKDLYTACRLLALLTVLTGIVYPLAVTGPGQFFFSSQSAGSPVVQAGMVRGSLLVAQKFKEDKFFQSRPSAGDYETMPSSASNLSPVAQKQLEAVQARMKSYPGAGSEFYYASASGLDPDISPRSAAVQMERVAKARCTSLDEVRAAVNQKTRQAVLEPPLINVLELNLLLEEKEYACKPGT